MSHQSDLIASDILAYLQQHEQKDLLRFITCGSVDDGKSTLIGRLLHDSKLVFEDQLAAVKRDSRKYNTTDDEVDLALLVDGLQAEREQGITIDVAYRYFSTSRRKYIIADCPGHEQYTRNMATGASTCDVAVILIDARRGVQAQTRRHSYIAALLGIRHIVVAVNKMDLVDWQADVFAAIRSEYAALAEALGLRDVTYVPMSALRGDNVVDASRHMPWHAGPTLMAVLEHIDIDRDDPLQAFRLPVQLVNRPHQDFRGYSGTIAAGSIARGERVVVLPSGKESRVRAVWSADREVAQAGRGEAVTLTLEDEIDISRGDMLVRAGDALPFCASVFEADLVWMSESPLETGREYFVKAGNRRVAGRIERILWRTDVNTLAREDASTLSLNGIARVRFRLSAPLVFDAYVNCRATGALIVIDRMSHATAAAGMITGVAQEVSGAEAEDGAARWQAFEIEFNALVRKHFPHWQARDVSALFGGGQD